MNPAQLQAQVRKMQAEMAKAQEEIAALVVTGSAGGNAVTIELTGEFVCKSVKVSPEAIDPSDPETLEDLLVVAISDATKKVQEASARRIGAVTGGMHIPGLT